MLDRITGNVFSVGQGLNTAGMSTDNYMKAMGGVNSAVDWTPIEPEEGIQTGVNATDEYLNQIRRLNDMGMALAAKGIDVMRPDPRNPESAAASRMFQDRLSRVKAAAAGLKTGQKVAEAYTTHRLKDNVIGRGFGGGTGGVATTEDLKNLKNIHPYLKALEDIATQTNSNYANSYNTPVEAQAAKLEIDKVRQKFDAMRPQLLAQGFSNEEATFHIEAAKAKLGDPTHDPLALREQEDRERTRAHQRYVASENLKTKKAKQIESKQLYDRVMALISGNPSAYKTQNPSAGPGSPGDVLTDDLFKGWVIKGKGEAKDDLVVTGIQYSGNRAYVVAAKGFGKNKKVQEYIPLNIDVVRTLLLQNRGAAALNSFLYYAGESMDEFGNLPEAAGADRSTEAVSPTPVQNTQVNPGAPAQSAREGAVLNIDEIE